MSDRDERAGGEREKDAERGVEPPRQGHAKEWAREVEAAETDGRGTGGVGEDAGGYEPLPEPE
jgi:hypothetical protein